jgi:hypothetical protein
LESGEIVAEFRKNWTEDKLMQIMNEWDNSIAAITTTVTTDEEE